MRSHYLGSPARSHDHAEGLPTVTDILSHDDDAVRTITLNRPHKLNALSAAGFRSVASALRRAHEDESIRCVIVTGSGGAFTAGMDLEDMSTPRPPDDGEPPGFVAFMEELEQFDKPLIAAVNGVAVGIGTTMLLHCDIVLAAQEARFRMPFVALGLAPEAGSSVALPQLVGSQEAASLLLTGRWFGADHARAIGLVWRVTSASALLPEAAALASEIAAVSLASLTETKRLLVAGRLAGVRAARERELEVYSRLLGGPANQQALRDLRSQVPGSRT